MEFDDPAQSLTAEGEDDAIAESLRDRLAAIGRAEQRLANGTYGRSVRSGLPIPDARLEADPAAELTVEEAAARNGAGPGRRPPAPARRPVYRPRAPGRAAARTGRTGWCPGSGAGG